MEQETDIVVVGAGPSGCAAAAALADLGLRVLVVEAGVNRSKQLAGELMHPAGTNALEQLGLLAAVRNAGAHSVRGFAVVHAAVPGTMNAGTAMPDTLLLPYEELGDGLALDHATLCESLMGAIEVRPGVTLWRNARVVAVPKNDLDGVEVRIAFREETSVRVQARLLVVADGRGSHTRGLLGIPDLNHRLSTMAGLLVEADRLPHPEYGHLFVGGPAPVLAYGIGGGRARIMIDLPTGAPLDAPLSDPAILGACSAPLQAAIIDAYRTQRPTSAANQTRIPTAVTRGRAVLVGDAAGCCHPISASGLTSCLRDAVALQSALLDHPDDVPAALARYVRLRRRHQRTRICLASALYRAFSEQSPEMALLRKGIMRYWRYSASGRRKSMALISSREIRMAVMAWEYSRVVGHSILALASARRRRETWALARPAAASVGLIRSTVPHVRETVIGALEEVGLAQRPFSPRRRSPLPSSDRLQ